MKLFILMGHRVESYEGEYGPEALETWDEYTEDENQQWIDEQLTKYKNDKTFASVAVIELKVSHKAIIEALYPKNKLESEVVSAKKV
jgi:hypothetical protein